MTTYLCAAGHVHVHYPAPSEGAPASCPRLVEVPKYGARAKAPCGRQLVEVDEGVRSQLRQLGWREP